MELRVHQPRDDERVLGPDEIRLRGRFSNARPPDAPVDRIGDLRDRRNGQRLPGGGRRRGRRDRRVARRPRSVQRPDPAGSRRRDPSPLVQRRRAQRPDVLRRPGSVRVRVRHGRADRRDRRRGQGGIVHRHPWPAEHPAAHRRGARRDRRVRCQHRGPGHRIRPTSRGATQRHRGVVPRQHRRRRDVRRRRHEYGGHRPDRAEPERTRPGSARRRRLRPGTDHGRAARPGRARLHHRPAAVPPGIPAGACTSTSPSCPAGWSSRRRRTPVWCSSIRPAAQLFLDTSSRFEGDTDEQKIVEPVGARGAPATTAG